MIHTSTDYIKAFQQRCENRSFFITRKGYIGLGSLSLEKGDSIVVIPGAYVPFAVTALRDIASDKQLKDTGNPKEEEKMVRNESIVVYRLKGEAYVHGVMYGERTLCKDWKLNTIALE